MLFPACSGEETRWVLADAGAAAKDSKDVRLPAMISGQELAALDAEASGHETTPPPRYTEASLVKALEEREIGRPSTYAATMSTISDRGYVDHRGQALVPTWLAFAVTRLLEENFAELVDYDFTASMERDLDRIAAGEELGPLADLGVRLPVGTLAEAEGTFSPEGVRSELERQFPRLSEAGRVTSTLADAGTVAPTPTLPSG